MTFDWLNPHPMRMLCFRMTSGVTGSLFVTTLKLSLKVRLPFLWRTRRSCDRKASFCIGDRIKKNVSSTSPGFMLLETVIVICALFISTMFSITLYRSWLTRLPYLRLFWSQWKKCVTVLCVLLEKVLPDCPGIWKKYVLSQLNVKSKCLLMFFLLWDEK